MDLQFELFGSSDIMVKVHGLGELGFRASGCRDSGWVRIEEGCVDGVCPHLTSGKKP